MRPRLLVLSGGEPPWADPWHPFRSTSDSVAAVGREAGFDVEVSGDVANRLADLTGVDVLVANAPSAEVPADTRAAAEKGLAAFLERSVGVLGLHTGVTTLAGLPAWSRLIGARWVQGVSGHPPLGPCTVQGLDDPRVPARRIELIDERYQRMAFAGPVEPLVVDEETGDPLVWAREVGDTRVIADALGHDERSLDSPEHRELLARCLSWLARIDEPA